jgi:hypothetical protein
MNLLFYDFNKCSEVLGRHSQKNGLGVINEEEHVPDPAPTPPEVMSNQQFSNMMMSSTGTNFYKCGDRLPTRDTKSRRGGVSNAQRGATRQKLQQQEKTATPA